MTFKEFIKKLKSIYTKFKDTSAIEQEGLIPKIPNQQGGYLIAFRHSNKITDKIGEFSYQISTIVPAIKYDASNAHTTISDFQIQDNFSPKTKTLEDLTKFVHENKPESNDIVINYNTWLLNQNTGIAAGEPNIAFYDLASKIFEYAKQQGTQLHLPWGAHITTNRFLENSTPEKAKELLEFCKNSKPLGYSTPESIDVGYFTFSPNGFNFNVFERFEL